MNALTRVIYAVIPADAAEGSGLCAGAPFVKTKAAADFPAVADLLLADADNNSNEFVAVQVLVTLLLGGERTLLLTAKKRTRSA